MKRLTIAILCVVFPQTIFATMSFGKSTSAGTRHEAFAASTVIKDDAQSLQLAVTEIRQSKTPDLDLLGRIVSLQMTLGHKANAKRNLEFLRSTQPDNGKMDQPLGKFFTNLGYTQEIQNFESTIEFLNQNAVGHYYCARWMKTTMISRAARSKHFALAEEILMSMNPGFPISGNDPVFMAAEFLVFPLYDNNKVDDAFRIISLFPDSRTRRSLGRSLATRAKNDPKIIEQVDKLLAGAPVQAELPWCRYKLDVALKSDDADAAIALFERCQQLGDKQTDWLKRRVGALLKSQGDARASQYVKTKKEVNDRLENRRFDNSLSNAAYGLQLYREGKLEKVIQDYGKLKREEVVPQSARLQTSRVQPLCSIAVKIASESRIEEALSVVEAIEDKYWRASTLLAVGITLDRNNDEGLNRLSKEALKIAQTIEYERERIIGSIVAARLDSNKVPFDEALEDLKLLKSDAQRAEWLGDHMEWRIRGRATPPELINRAVDIIVAGDPRQLYNVIDILMYDGQVELAASSLAKLNLDSEVEPDNYPFMVFRELVQIADWSRQWDFISKSPKSVRGRLFLIALKNPKFKESDLPVVYLAALKHLKETKIDIDLYGEVLDTCFKLGDFKALGQLTTDEVLTLESNQEYISEQLKNLAVEYATSKGKENLDTIEKHLQSSWSRKALLRAKIQTFAVLQTDNKLSNSLIDAVSQPEFRAELRYLSVAGKLKRKILVQRPYW